jgi:hypothetical protein
MVDKDIGVHKASVKASLQCDDRLLHIGVVLAGGYDNDGSFGPVCSIEPWFGWIEVRVHPYRSFFIDTFSIC